ncbi:DUF397 domain-containing protein [Couchioplanes azureus]|uniref:DUF397 domain-containing protein n=1 Tax=Couchioplanes caeruleus TaxID=56438 RepID=UPI001670EA51|nr:DUF397 domain-containing protein [Couchioplanes caeruleus]GGQ88490.1 hypothetical protein GCM10010166_67910 [Couchioplanes caeruleus subsp. azureus]
MTPPLSDSWRKSARSMQGNCVEVSYSQTKGMVLVRDTKANGQGPILGFTPDEWSTFLAGVRDGEFEIPSGVH